MYSPTKERKYIPWSPSRCVNMPLSSHPIPTTPTPFSPVDPFSQEAPFSPSVLSPSPRSQPHTPQFPNISIAPPTPHAHTPLSTYWPNDELRERYGGDDNGLEVVPGQSHLPGKEVSVEEAHVPVMHHSLDGNRTPSGGVLLVEGSKGEILRMRKITIVLVAALIAVVILSVVVGSVAGRAAVKNAKSEGFQEGLLAQDASATKTVTMPSNPSTAPTDTPSTSTSSSRISVPTAGLLPLDCPALTSTKPSVSIGDKLYEFEATCGVDNPSAESDIVVLAAYSFEDCLRACASLSSHKGDDDDGCVGVQFSAKLDPSEDGTCWLKREWPDEVVDKDEESKDLHVAAKLVT